MSGRVKTFLLITALFLVLAIAYRDTSLKPKGSSIHEYTVTIMNNAQIVDFFKDKPYLAYPVYVCGDSKECAMRILPARAVPTPLYQGNKISIRTSEDISQTEGLLSVEDITLVIIDTQ